MIKFDIDEKNAFVEIHPDGTLEEDDFTSLTTAVDAFIEAKGDLSGMLIQTETFTCRCLVFGIGKCLSNLARTKRVICG